MCLTTKVIKAANIVAAKKLDIARRVVKTAKKDIICWKIFNTSYLGARGLFTLFQNFKWPKNNKLVTVEGFRIVKDRDGREVFGDVYEGLHAYAVQRLWFRRHYCGEVKRKMIIPKGTKYIMSGNGHEIVALAMKIAPSKKKPVKKTKKKKN